MKNFSKKPNNSSGSNDRIFTTPRIFVLGNPNPGVNCSVFGKIIVEKIIFSQKKCASSYLSKAQAECNFDRKIKNFHQKFLYIFF